MIIHPLDNVEVREDGHKYAIRPIAPGENVIKYGMPIGHAKVQINPIQNFISLFTPSNPLLQCGEDGKPCSTSAQ